MTETSKNFLRSKGVEEREIRSLETECITDEEVIAAFERVSKERAEKATFKRLNDLGAATNYSFDDKGFGKLLLPSICRINSSTLALKKESSAENISITPSSLCAYCARGDNF